MGRHEDDQEREDRKLNRWIWFWLIVGVGALVAYVVYELALAGK
jgi:hypothetical protein